MLFQPVVMVTLTNHHPHTCPYGLTRISIDKRGVLLCFPSTIGLFILPVVGVFTETVNERGKEGDHKDAAENAEEWGQGLYGILALFCRDVYLKPPSSSPPSGVNNSGNSV